MKKTLLILMSFLIAGLVYGETTRGAQTGMAVLKIGDETQAAMRVNLSPEFQFSKLSLGLKLSAYLGDGGLVDVNADGKNDIDDLEYGVRYIGWDGDYLKAKYGAIDDLTIGHGSLMYNYTNNEKTSVYGEINYLQDEEKLMGLSVLMPLKRNFLGNANEENEEPRAAGFRVYVRPVKFFTELPVISKLEAGMTVLKDNKGTFYNTVEEKYETDTDGNAVEYDGTVEGTSMELALPLVENDGLNLTAYIDSVKVEGDKDSAPKNEGKGTFLGVIGNISFVDYKFEYRSLDENLKANYFGTFYEAKYNEYLDNLLFGSDNKISGYFGDVNFNFGEAVDFNLTYEDYDSSESKPYLSAKLDVVASEKLNGFMSYQQEDFGNDGLLNENTLIKAGFSAPASLIGIPGPFTADIDIEQRYYYDEETDTYEPFRAYSLSLAFVF